MAASELYKRQTGDFPSMPRALPVGGLAPEVTERARTLAGVAAPPGGAVAQRLRGYKWRSEKSVKAIAPTGAALAFLCFDFYFRIVKGV